MGVKLLILCAAPLLFACGPSSGTSEKASNRVATSGKAPVPLEQVPAEVTAAAKAAQPALTIASAEAETRDGRRYFDVGGTLPDGAEIELDIMEEGGRWRVVETQRDIEFSAAPAAVQVAARADDPAISPTRVIASRQEDGIVIYEIYSPSGGDPQGRKLEIRWDGRQALVLTQEWAH